MDETAKYLIHADITADGVVERNDVVGAIFGQTEGLLGEDLDLHELQDNSKVGRIDVDVASESGQSFGEITIASGLDRVETALLAAALETIERVGPCRATIEVSELEDVRSAKRRAVVERATDLLADLEDESVTSTDIVEAVRQRVRVEDATEYEGYPAGPRVADSDAVVVVEGRADVLQLLQYGVKNAVAVEGTSVPDAVADLTERRTVTAFVDGDRGGELVLKELAQVGSVDYAAFAPPGTAVEDLSRAQITTALREKVPYETLADVSESDSVADGAADGGGSTPPDVDAVDGDATEATPGGSATLEPPSATEATRDDAATADEPAATDGSATADGSATTDGSTTANGSTADGPAATERPAANEPTARTGSSVPETEGESDAVSPADATVDATESPAETIDESSADATDESPATVAGHAQTVIGAETGRVRLLDGDARSVADGPAADAFDLVERAETVPATVVLDGPVSQRLLDVAAQRGVDQVVAADEGEFVKRPTNVRVRTVDEF